MATLNEMIAQGAQFYTPDPAAQYNKMAQMQKYQQENELAKMQMEEYGRARQESNALRQFLPGLNESNRSQLLGYGAAGQGVYKALAEGGKEQRLSEQAVSQTALHKSNILKNAVEQTRNAVAGIDPTDVESYAALRTGVLTQYPELTPYMPAAWDANVKQRLITTAASVLEGQKPRPPVILSPGQMAIPGNDPRLMGTGVTAPAAAPVAKAEPTTNEITNAKAIALGVGIEGSPEFNERFQTELAKLTDKKVPVAAEPTTPEIKNAMALALGAGPVGSFAYNDRLQKELTRLTTKAEPVTAPQALTTEERNARAIALGAGPEGSDAFNAALRTEISRMTAKPAAAVTAPEPTTNEIKNAKAIALGSGPEGSFAYNDRMQKELARLTAKTEPITAAPAPTPEMKNADSFARLKGEPGTPAYNKEYIARMEKFTAKSSGGGEGGGTAVPKAPSGYRFNKAGDLEPIPGGPAAGKPLTDLQKQGLKKDFAADTSKIKAAVDTADEMEKLTDDLVGNTDKKIKPHPGLSGITGYQGLLASFPESPVTSGNAAKAEQKLETFKGKIKALGRSIASLDGKLGNMAVQEWQMVSDSVQAIKPTAGNLEEQMRDAVRQARLLAKNLRDKFDLTYEDTTPAAAPSRPAAAALAPADKQALDWANANPKDPRSLQIKQRLGQ